MKRRNFYTILIAFFSFIFAFFAIGNSIFVIPGDSTIDNIGINSGTRAVCYNGDKRYTTIEKALERANSGDTIYVYPDLKDSSGNLQPVYISKSCTIKSGVTLSLPYVGTTVFDSSAHGDKNSFADADAASVKKNRKTQVIIGPNVSLTMESGSHLNIGGIVGGPGPGLSGETTSSYCEITLSTGSKISCNGGTINCYGYIKQTERENGSQLIVTNSGKLHSPFVIYDFKGGAATLGIYNLKGDNRYCPFSVFDVCNVQTTVRIFSGATWEVRSLVYIGTNKTYYPENDTDRILNFIGPTNQKTLLVLTSGYALIQYVPKTNGITAQGTDGARTNIHIYGTLDIGSLRIVLKVAAGDGIGEIITKTIDLNTVNFFLPVSYRLSITVKQGGTLNIAKRVKFMNASKLTIEKGATLNVSEKIIFYDENFKDLTPSEGNPSSYPLNLGSAMFINNGTVNVLGTGGIGGMILTTSENAILDYRAPDTLFEISSPEYGGNMPGGVDAVLEKPCDVSPVLLKTTYLKVDKIAMENTDVGFNYASEKQELTVHKIYSSVKIGDTENYGWYYQSTYHVRFDAGSVDYTNPNTITSVSTVDGVLSVVPLVPTGNEYVFGGYYYTPDFSPSSALPKDSNGNYMLDPQVGAQIADANGLNTIYLYSRWIDAKDCVKIVFRNYPITEKGTLTEIATYYTILGEECDVSQFDTYNKTMERDPFRMNESGQIITKTEYTFNGWEIKDSSENTVETTETTKFVPQQGNDTYYVDPIYVVGSTFYAVYITNLNESLQNMLKSVQVDGTDVLDKEQPVYVTDKSTIDVTTGVGAGRLWKAMCTITIGKESRSVKSHDWKLESGSITVNLAEFENELKNLSNPITIVGSKA